MDQYDVIIVGCGPAGMEAALFASRAGLKTLVIGTPWAGQLALAQSIGNLLGSDGVNGKELIQRGLDQMKHYGAEFIEQEVTGAEKKKEGGFSVKTGDGRQFDAKNLIIATGTQYRELGVKGEYDLAGRGVHYCVACDGYHYRGKRVAVVGHGNYAAEEAAELTAHTKDVTILTNGREPEFSDAYKKLLETDGVKVQKDRVKEFVVKDGKLGGIINGDDANLDFAGAFVALGTATGLDFADNLGLQSVQGGLVVDPRGKTNADGVYAAGACTGAQEQISVSMGMGCTAALSIIKKLKGLETYVDQT